MSGLVLAVVDDGSRNPGPIPLLIIALMGVALFFLIRNMNGRLKRMPKEFPPPAPPAQGEEPTERS